MQNRFSNIEVIEPITVKVRRTKKITLFVGKDKGEVLPKVIHVTGMTIPQIQKTFVVGSEWGWNKTIQAVTIE